MIRKAKSVEFERKCLELSMAIINALQTIENYTLDHLKHVYLDLLKSVINEQEKHKYY